jgi:nucleoid-associated protein YgaU
MGIFDSFKKALGNKTEGESDKISTAVQDNADGDSTQVDATPANEPEAVRVEEGSYTVQSGDTLWAIAETAYGDGSKYMNIFDANRNLLEDPDRIYPGQQLLIPDLTD